MQNQYLQYSNAAPTVRLFAYDSTTGLAKTGLVFGGVTVNYARDNGANVALTLVTATLGTWVSNGFVERGAGVYDLYLPIAANASGAKSLLITATAAATVFDPFVVQLGVDDLSTAGLTAGEIATAVAAPSAATIATAVDAAVADNFAAIPAAVDAVLADNFAALPSAAAIITALRAETTLSAWGVTSQPTGGSTLTYPERRNGTSIGTRTAYFDSTGKPVGLTAVV